MSSPIDPDSPSDPTSRLTSRDVWQIGTSNADPQQNAGLNVAEQVTPEFTDPWAVPSQICSWIVIIFCTILMMSMVFVSQFIAPPERQSPAATLVPVNLAGQLALGMEPLDKNQAEELLKGLDSGPIPQRLARLVILTEMVTRRKDADPAETLEILNSLDRLHEQMQEVDYQPTDDERKLIEAAEKVIRAKVAGEPLASDSDAVQTVEKDLGFAGQVAASWSSDDPQVGRRLRDRSTAKLFGVGLFFVLVAAAAVGGLFVAAILVACLLFGLLRSGWLGGSGYGFIHLEAFAVWFVSFFVAQFVMGMLVSVLGLGDDASIWLTLLMFYIPVVVALGWLLVRHPQPGRALREVGFTSQNVALDLGKAVVTHLAFLPLLAVMIFLIGILTSLIHSGGTAENPFAPPGGPSHPIQEQFDGQMGTVLMLFLLAAVTAPLVEETVFRGLLYRYLRDVTHRQSIYLSVLVSTLINGFIFASIHPQGLLGIPVLMTLAASMSIAREWTGGLIAPMAIHALNNGALVALMAVMFAN